MAYPEKAVGRAYETNEATSPKLPPNEGAIPERMLELKDSLDRLDKQLAVLTSKLAPISVRLGTDIGLSDKVPKPLESAVETTLREYIDIVRGFDNTVRRLGEEVRL